MFMSLGVKKKKNIKNQTPFPVVLDWLPTKEDHFQSALLEVLAASPSFPVDVYLLDCAN